VTGTVGALGVGWRIFEWWFANRVKLRVTVGQGTVGWSPASAIIVSAVNKGRRSVKLARGYLRFEDGSTLAPPLEQFGQFESPLSETRPRLMIWFALDPLKQKLRDVGLQVTHACFEDELGRPYCAKFPTLSFLDAAFKQPEVTPK